MSGRAIFHPAPPWHLWGTTIQLEAPPVPLGTPNFRSRSRGQLARINYKRPETWSFFLGARLTGGNISLGGPQLVEVRINLLFGIGRSVFSTRQRDPQNPLSAGDHAFCTFQWNILAGVNPSTEPAKYTTQVYAPIMYADLPAFTNTIDWIPAQDLQAEVDLIHTKSDENQTLTAEATAYFAPRSHIRPDWFTDGREEEAFQGQETKGT